MMRLQLLGNPDLMNQLQQVFLFMLLQEYSLKSIER